MNARAQPSFFRNGGPDRPPSALDKKMDERERLSAAYRQAKKKQREELDASAPPEWPSLIAAIRTMTPDPATGQAFIAWLETQRWLIDAEYRHRSYALELIDARINRILQHVGREPLDDPVDKPTIFFRARAILMRLS